MKKIVLASLLAVAVNFVHASEPVTIGGVKTLKYSDSEVRDYVKKMNAVRTDMTVDQVIAILGRPYREQLVSPRQRIFVYPLSIIVSFYRNSQSGQWQVTAPTLYTNPYCQRMDGAPQAGVLGQDATEYSNVNCIPKPGSKHQADAWLKPAQPVKVPGLPAPEKADLVEEYTAEVTLTGIFYEAKKGQLQVEEKDGFVTYVCPLALCKTIYESAYGHPDMGRAAAEYRNRKAFISVQRRRATEKDTFVTEDSVAWPGDRVRIITKLELR
jgi:hypothetical protein